MNPTTDTSGLRARLASRQLLVVTGKGGVGKTVVAATLGRLLAAGPGRRRVLVLEVDPRESLHRMFDLPPSGGEVAAAGDGLFLQNLKPGQVLDRVVEERLKIGALSRRVLSSPVYQNFSEGAPGLKEVAVLGHALRLVEGIDPALRGEPFDTVVLDAPATGHGVSMLSAPRLLSEVIEDGPFGAMGSELAAFVADPGRCGVVVVTTAEEMPVAEAFELAERLDRDLGRGVELLAVNGVYPPLPEGVDAEAAAADPALGPAFDPALDPVLDLWSHRRRLQEREMARLAERWRGPRVELPKLPFERGPVLVDALHACLLRRLAALSAGPADAAGGEA